MSLFLPLWVHKITQNVFIDKTQKERKELLSQFMGLTIFDGLYTQHEDIKEVDTLLKNFKKEVTILNQKV